MILHTTVERSACAAVAAEGKKRRERERDERAGAGRGRKLFGAFSFSMFLLFLFYYLLFYIYRRHWYIHTQLHISDWGWLWEVGIYCKVFRSFAGGFNGNTKRREMGVDIQRQLSSSNLCLYTRYLDILPARI